MRSVAFSHNTKTRAVCFRVGASCHCRAYAVYTRMHDLFCRYGSSSVLYACLRVSFVNSAGGACWFMIDECTTVEHDQLLPPVPSGGAPSRFVCLSVLTRGNEINVLPCGWLHNLRRLSLSVERRGCTSFDGGRAAPPFRGNLSRRCLRT